MCKFLQYVQKHNNSKKNKGQSNLAKGDIAQLVMLYAREILSTSSIIFARWQHTSRSWS